MNLVRAIALVCVLSLPGCATLDPDYEQPTVTLSSFRALPAEGMLPNFEIGLRILNPNAQALNLDGIVYTISLDGYELVKGVGKDFPVIEGYSEEAVTLTASANLLAGMRSRAALLSMNSKPSSTSADSTLQFASGKPATSTSMEATRPGK
jgi:hypothetical protein